MAGQTAFRKAYDGGVRAPSTGQVKLLNPITGEYLVSCYTCDFDSKGADRAKAIEKHLQHYQDSHPY